MPRQLTAEHKAKLAAGRAKSKKQWVVTTIDLGKGWSIAHSDPWNYDVYDGETLVGHYGKLPDALCGVIRHASGKGLSGEIKDVVNHINALEAWVKSPAFWMAGARG